MKQDTSWEKSGKWYKNLVGKKGHHYHKAVIIPGVEDILLKLNPKSVLDLACGNGVLSEYIRGKYVGIDKSKSLINEARKRNKGEYLIADITEDINLSKSFDLVTIILALQNTDNPDKVIQNAKKHLSEKGKLVIVINHPAFRIPRHSGWEEKNGRQLRWLDSYMSFQKIPINMHPGQLNSETTLSFHWPLSAISRILYQNNLVIERIDEWISDKKSDGGKRKIENNARKEFPLFMAIIAHHEHRSLSDQEK